MVRDAIAGGMQGLFLAGTCGEGPWLPDLERTRLVKAAVKAGAGKLKIAAQVSDNSVPRILDNVARMADAGADITASQLAVPAAAPELRPGQRIVDLVAAGSARLVTAGSRADVLVTREGGSTRLALEGVVVVAATRAPPDPSSGLPRVQASLLVSVRQAVYLTEAQAFAREQYGDQRRRADRGEVMGRPNGSLGMLSGISNLGQSMGRATPVDYLSILAGA